MVDESTLLESGRNLRQKTGDNLVPASRELVQQIEREHQARRGLLETWRDSAFW